MTTQFRLPFTQLEDLRFEDLCLRVMVQEYNLQRTQHPGRAGSDGGGDILGFFIKNEPKTHCAVQCKRYEKIAPGDLLKALEEFHKGYPNFKGQFWIITSAVPSKKARDGFNKAALAMELEPFVIDGSSLETSVRNNPELMQEFFSAPKSLPERNFHCLAVEIIKKVQKFETEFLDTRHQNSCGNFAFIRERQQAMAEVLNKNINELESEMSVICDSEDKKTLQEIKIAATVIISNYRHSSEITNQGLPTFGATEASKARMKDFEQEELFKKKCEKLRTQMKRHL